MATPQPMMTRSKLRLGDESDEGAPDNSNDEDDLTGARAPPPRRASTRIAKAAWTPPAPIAPPHYRTPYSQLDPRRIVTEMKKSILFQDQALCELATLLMMVHAPDFDLSPHDCSLRKNIHARCLSGPSGVGKTESVLMVRRLLGMRDGEPNAAHYIHIDGSVYNDVTQINRLCGSGPGYAGSEQRNSLVDDLRRAIEPPELDVLRAMSPKHRDYAKHAAHYRALKEAGKLSYPAIVLLFIDEIDKAHVNFMTVMNGLLDSGQMKSSRGDPFVLPRQTQLLVLFTANFGHEAIARMTTRDPQEAAAHVEAAMRAKGLHPNSVERFGGHVIFFPIDKKNIAAVVRKKVDEMMESETSLTRKYGTIDYKEAVQCIVDFVEQVSDPVRGIRNTMGHLTRCIRPLLLEAFQTLEQMSVDQLASACNELGLRENTLRLFMETLHTGMFDEAAQDDLLAASGQNTSALVRCVMSNERNAPVLDMMQREGGTQSIHAIGMAHNGSLINCVLIPLIVKNYTIKQYDTQASHDAIDEVRQGYRALREDYCVLQHDYKELVVAISEVQATDELAEIVRSASEKEHAQAFLQFSDDSDEEPERKRPALDANDADRAPKKLRRNEERVRELMADPAIVEVMDEDVLDQIDDGVREPGVAEQPDADAPSSDASPDEEAQQPDGALPDAAGLRHCPDCLEHRHADEFLRVKWGRKKRDGTAPKRYVCLEHCLRCYNKHIYLSRKSKA